jgi:hypothetical protein
MEADEATTRLMTGEIWATFCDLLRQAGDEIRRPGLDDPLDVAEGYRLLTRLLRGSLESVLEYGTPTHPHLICTCHETIKIVAENPDTYYLGSSVSGQHEYRVWGTRGEAAWLSFNTFGQGGFGGGGTGVGATLHEQELVLDDDGTFELFLSHERRGDNWLRHSPDTSSLVIRQTFLRKKSQRPAELHIERLDPDGAPPSPLDAAHLERALVHAGHYIRGVASIGARWAERNREHPNRFVDVQLDDTRAFRDPQIIWHQCYFVLDDEQALVVEFTPPRCDYWMIALHNHWMETLDYRYHVSTLNAATAAVRADGRVRCVVAARDPGTDNWLDTAGHRNGVLGVRWVGADVDDVVPDTWLTTTAEVGP